MELGYYKDLPIDEYHGSDAVSKSTLDWVDKAPALVKWAKNAPRDNEKTASVDIGQAFHTLVLEPSRFDTDFIIAPHFNLRKNADKADKVDFYRANSDKTILTFEEMHKLRLMYESTMAHPYAHALLRNTGDAEASIFWKDKETGLTCRIRPDKLPKDWLGIADVKTTADIERVHQSVDLYRYHVQDAFYSEGYERHFGRKPEGFIFIFVSTVASAGRYPVRVYELPINEKEDGRTAFRENLNNYARCQKTNHWPGIEKLNRPSWAKR